MRGLLQYCCILSLAFLACVSPAHALRPDKAFDHYEIDTWSIEDGLPQITAVCLAQDRTGYVWVGTQGGLSRFDGVRFLNFTPQTEPALAGIWIRSLLADRRGRLWIGTYKGLTLYEDGHFSAVPAADIRRFPSPDVYALVEQADGTIVAGTSDGVFRFGDGKLQAIDGPQPALSLLPVDGGLWIGSIGGVERINRDGRAQFALPRAAASAAVSRLVQVGDQLWAGTSQGLYALDADGWAPVQANPGFDRSPVTAMMADHDSNLWIGSSAGLARFRDGTLVEFVPDKDPRAFRQVIATMEDREGNLWFGSQLSGLARIWNGWTRRYSNGEGLHDPIVWSLTPDPDGRRLWVGTNDGLSLFDHGRFQQVVPGKALPHPNAYNLLAEPDQVWIGTRRGLVLWRNGRVETLPELAPLASAQINGIVRAGDGSLWVASSDGVFRLHDGQLQRFGQAQGLRDPRVRAIRFLDDGRILLGTQGGLFELRDGIAHPLGLDTGLPPNTDISALYVMRDGRLVVGTLAEKSYIEAGGRWHELGPAQGLPANSPFFIVQDDRYLWLAGIRGITRVPLANLPDSARSDDRPLHGELVLNERGDPNAGQQGYCCNGAGMSKGFLRGDTLWLPSRDGVVALDTTAIVKNPQPPSLLIERVHTSRGWRDLSAPHGEPLALPAAARDLGFEFTALSFQDPRSVQLRYRLRGYDQAWHRVEDPRRRSANYTNLPPGNYAFEVIGANNAGVWSRTPAILRFRIAPFFHETWLFRWLLAALLAAALYAGYRYQLQRHQLQRGQLETDVQVRTRELHAANARLENASQTDLLTGLRNRRYLANQLPADLAYYDRETHRSGDYGQVVVFALVAIDDFGHLHDSHGQHVGDQALQQFSQVLASLVRSGDYLARWGGEHFLLVLRPMHSEHLAMIGERIHAAIAAHRFLFDNAQVDDKSLHLACSVGLAGYRLFNVERQPGWEQMVDLAEAAQYWSRRQGGGGWAAFQPAPGTDATTLLQDLQGDVDGLIASGRLQVLTSQPAVGRSPVGPPDTSSPVRIA